MALFDKFNKDGLLDKAKELASKTAEAAKDSLRKSQESLKQYKNDSKELKEAVEGAIIRYEVVYVGGLPQYPKEKAGEIGLNIMQDSFILKKTIGTKDWFDDFEIPYDSVQSFAITKRQAGNWEMMFSSDSTSARSTEVENVLAITYIDEAGTEILLRLEMLTGFTVYNQAKTCQAMMDILRQNNILNRLNKTTAHNTSTTSSVDEIKKFKELLDMGILTQEEFDAKKKQLLGL